MSGGRVVPRVTIFFITSLSLLVASEAMAASDTSICLSMGTKLEAGILVTDRDLIAAHQACARARESARDGIRLMKLVVASGAIEEEFRRRGAVSP
jgi:hypothetical protein